MMFKETHNLTELATALDNLSDILYRRNMPM